MPLFDYECGDRHRFEEFFKAGSEIPLTLPCTVCKQPAIKQLSSPAFTPGRWGDQTGKYGVNGCYDKGLGATYHTSMERERIMDARGLVDAGSFDKHFHEDKIERATTHVNEHRADVRTLNETLRETKGDAGQAIAETFSVKRMKEKGYLNDEVKG